MFFSPILFPELILSNEVFLSGPPMDGPDSGCSINAYPPGIIGLLSNN
jgi:hypothetical protein